MTKKISVLFFILIFFLCSCRQSDSSIEYKKAKSDSIQFDTSKIAIIKLDNQKHLIFENYKPTELTNENILEIEKILLKCIDNYNPTQESYFKEVSLKHPEYKFERNRFIIDLSDYYRQYVASINNKGEKEVWVNCFCHSLYEDWKKYLIIVEDGGNCFFNLKINLNTRKYYDLMVNGDA